MPLNIIRDDLVNRNADAVVVSANSRLVIDGGNGLAVASRFGLEKIQNACRQIGTCATGKAVAVKTGDEDVPLLVFAVGPVWNDGTHDEAETLRETVSSALHLAVENGARSIALPLISTGAFGFPAELAFQITSEVALDFLQKHDVELTLVLYDRASVKAAIDFGEIESFIDDNYVDERRAERRFGERGSRFLLEDWEAEVTFGAMPAQPDVDAAKESSRASRRTSAVPTEAAAPAGTSTVQSMSWKEFEELFPAQDDGLEEWLDNRHATFTTTLLELIDARGLADSAVYKRANMSRQLFSKIRSDLDYRPKKKTVLALAIALELSLEETSELLNCAGFSLSRSSKFDLIIEYFIRKNQYDCFAINEALFAFGEELLS